MKKLLSSIFLCVVLSAFTMAAFSSCGGKSSIPAGNVTNCGYVLVDGNDIYYTKVIITALSSYGNIYKYNTTNKTEILVAEIEVDYQDNINAYLTLYNGDLYFLPYFSDDPRYVSSPNIYKVKPDGKNTKPEPLFAEDISCTYMQIQGGLIYYYDDTEMKLYSVNTNGSNKKLICEASMLSVSMNGSTAYFADDSILNSVSLAGGKYNNIYDFMEQDDGFYLQDIILDGDYIYYSDDEYSRIGRIKTNGTGDETIYSVADGSDEYINYFNVSGNTVYIVVENYGLKKNFAILSVDANGGTPKAIVSDNEELGAITPISIWGERIYYCAMPIKNTTNYDSYYIWYSVSKTGGNPAVFNPLTVYDEKYDEDRDDWNYYRDSDDESGEEVETEEEAPTE